MKKNLLLLFASTLFVLLTHSACNNEVRPSDQVVKSQEDNEKALVMLQHNCFSCHHPDMEIKDRAAPPMFKVKEHYYDNNTTRESFIKNVVDFVNNPTEENSKMPGALRHFGLMPKLTYKEEDLRMMVEYIYDQNLDSDSWYKEWEELKNRKQTTAEELSYEDLGLNYANETKAQLGKNLLAAIKEFGTSGAVEFCNTRAIPLTDSMANVFKASIKRVSDKPRNPNNIANEVELAYINELKNNLLANQKTGSKIVEKENKIVAYYPIETNKMCLQCHGKKGTDIFPETYKVLNKLYPSDKAFDYGENQIRGLWVVEMVKK